MNRQWRLGGITQRLFGFSAQHVMASWNTPNTTGKFDDFDEPRNAPSKNPLAHLDKVAFHSSFYLYERAIDQVVTISHPAATTTQPIGPLADKAKSFRSQSASPKQKPLSFGRPPSLWKMPIAVPYDELKEITDVAPPRPQLLT